jgi:hypothetical protein
MPAIEQPRHRRNVAGKLSPIATYFDCCFTLFLRFNGTIIEPVARRCG